MPAVFASHSWCLPCWRFSARQHGGRPRRAEADCTGGPWIDARCYGALGNGKSDDTAALEDAVHAAIATDTPLMLPHGTYRLTRPLVIDYQKVADTGFRLISMGAILDGRRITIGPALRIVCSGGTPAAPKGCFYFKEEGTLFVNADTDHYAVVVGRRDFSDAQNSIKIDHLIVNNANTGPNAGGLQLNYVLSSEIFAVADSAGGAAGIALEQTQISKLERRRLGERQRRCRPFDRRRLQLCQHDLRDGPRSGADLPGDRLAQGGAQHVHLALHGVRHSGRGDRRRHDTARQPAVRRQCQAEIRRRGRHRGDAVTGGL